MTRPEMMMEKLNIITRIEEKGLPSNNNEDSV